MVELSSSEVAKLVGKDDRTVRRWAESGKLNATVSYTDTNVPKYLFPLDLLDKEYQDRYFRSKRMELAKVETASPIPIGQREPIKPIEYYTAAEREEIAFWADLVTDWLEYRRSFAANATVVDKVFIDQCKLKYPGRPISKDILYRRWKSLREKDYDGLIEKRGKARKGKSTIPEVAWQAFLFFYLDQAKHPITKCYEYTKLWTQAERPELVADLPHYTTFYRHLQQDVPEAVETLGRSGDKAFDDRCAPYIRRIYDDMASNEYWVADNHTFDIISAGTDGKRHRLYLTAFFDARSGIFTGCHVTDAPCSQATLIALRKGILKYGIPENIYVDNGREFLTFDIGGLGHRTKKPKDGEEKFLPPPVFTRLGIKMTNAIVRNAKAKIIERRFLDIKNQFSRLFETFTGGTVVEKPEKLKGVLKNGIVPTDSTLIETIETLLDWYFNQQPYGGAVASDRGKPRMQVYNECLTSKRVASPEDLNLMLMRSSRPQKVTRRGVHLDIAGQRLDYWNDDFVFNLLDKQVYYRYDPENLAEVRIYDLEDRFIMTVPADNIAVCTYGASQDEVKAAMSKTHRMKQLTKEAIKSSILPFVNQRTALELELERAHMAKTARIVPDADPKVLTIQRADEEPLLKAVSGGLNLERMARNAMKNQGGEGYEQGV